MHKKPYLSLTLIFCLSLLSGPLNAQVVVNTSNISGEVTVGGTAETEITNLQISASGALGNSTTSLSPNPAANAVSYQATVSVPVGSNTTYNVQAYAYMDQNRDQVRFRSVSVPVGDGAPATGVDFALDDPGFIEGEVSVSGATVNTAYIYIYAPSSTGVSYSFTRTYSNGAGSSPPNSYRVAVPSGETLTVRGDIYLTSGTRISIPPQTITVAAGDTATADISLQAPTTGSIGGDISFTGDLPVWRYYIQSSGTSSTVDYVQGPFAPPGNAASYELESLTPYSTYRVYGNAEFLDTDTTNRKYFRFPNGSFSPANYPIDVGASETETVDLIATQALITGTIDFTGSVSLADANQLYVQAYGYGSASGGNGRDFVAPSGSGEYEIVATPGDWRPYFLFMQFFDNGGGVPADYRNTYVNYTDDVVRSSPLSTSAALPATQDHEIAFGEITVNIDASGSPISNPRIDYSYCEYRDENDVRLYYYYVYAYTSGQTNVTEASVSAIAPEGTCSLRISGTVGGASITLGTVEVEVVAGAQQQQDVGGPSLTVTFPDPDTVVDASTVDVEGTATDDVAVQSVTVNGTGAVLTPVTPGDYSAVEFEAAGISIPLKGPNEIQTVAIDTSDKSTTDTRTVYNDAGPPTIDWAPAAGSVVGELSVDVSGIAEDDAGVDSVTVNGQTVAIAPPGGTSVAFELQGLPLVEGSNSITVIATDISQLETSETREVTVVLNSAPLADDQSVATDEDSAASITLTGSDGEGDALSFGVVSDPDNGTVSCSGSACTYTPDENYNGIDSFTFKTNDGVLDSNVATVSVTVNAINDAPVANDDTASTNEDTPVTTSVLVNDSDVDGDDLSVSGSADGGNGSVSCTADSCTYTPNADFNGTDSYTYTISDGNGGSDTATVSVSISAVNDAPTADNGSAVTDEDQAASITLTGADIDGDSLTYSVVSGPSNGTLSGMAPNLTYTPAENYNGSDSFTFKANDGALDSNVATVNITVNPVNDAPTANNGSATTDEDVAVGITLTGGDIDGDSLTYSVVAGPANGTLSCTAASCTYTPAENYYGADSFTFKANDGALDSNMATVNITVNPVNDAPTANNGSASTDEDVAVGITLTGDDIDGDALAYSVVAGPTNGTLSCTAASCTYTPAENYYGADSFTFKANDGALDSNVATVNITVNPVNDAPTANNGSASTDEDVAVGITLTGGDIDGDTLAYSVVGGPSNGTLSGTAPNLTYTPAADFNGSDSFTFKTSDGALDSDLATISITVNPVNDAPVATDDSVSTNEDTVVATSVMSNDNGGPSDEDQALTFVGWTNGMYGTVSCSGSACTYTPAADFNGSDSYTYTIEDSDGLRDTATVSVAVIPVNDVPIAVDDSATTDEDTPAATGVLGNDNGGPPDEDQALTFVGWTNGMYGTVSCSGSACTYTPAADFNGSDSYTYTIADSGGLTATATVSVIVNAVNDAPTVDADDVTVQYSDPVSVTISGDDIDSTNLSIETSALPDGLTLSAATCAAGAPPVDCGWTVTGNITEGPGSYQVSVTVRDDGELTDSTTLTGTTTFVITVEQEDARSTYTGPLFLSSAENGDFTVTLMATIRDITAVGGDAANDPDAGDISNASVDFVDENGAVLCSASAVTLVFSGDETTGSASCDYTGSLGNSEEVPLEVGIVVNDHYVDTRDNEVVILVVRPGDGKITGGGQLELANSAGVYTADPDLRTNYGFNAMAQKKGKKKVQLKGRMTIILRATDGHKYKIKSNALLSLGTDLDPDGDGNSQDEPFYAEFESKANLTDVTDPLNPISLGGNLLLQMRMTDNGEPGENDTISLTLWDGGTLLFSSNWDGSQSVEQQVARGNLQVHP